MFCVMLSFDECCNVLSMHALSNKENSSDQVLSALTLVYGTSDLVLTIKPLKKLIFIHAETGKSLIISIPNN